MCKSNNNVIHNPPIKEACPRYISNDPQGEDLFEGKSQERLADAIAMHIEEADLVEKPVFARLVGLEGKWGSGKSNVIKILQDKLKDTYTFFTFDAWGNQEDLQRRSILESLTRTLIEDEVLQGSVKMKLRNGKINEASWEDQLTLLLSNKTTSIRKSTPKLTAAAFWGIGIVVLFALCSLFAGQLINTFDDFRCYWWIDVIPIVTAVIVAGWYRKKDGSFDNIFRMVDHTNNDTIEEEFTSNEEPSVVEFKNWLQTISDFIGGCNHEHKKLVIVFDNMDRLPSEKVRQFWSLIQTFFADDGYKNIWCVVPYDENHLAAVFSDSEDNNTNMRLLRGFLDKTFPVVYRVPEPVVADYNKLFERFFRNAFGTTVDGNSYELISQCYRHEHPIPNVRDVITFVNKNVMLAKQWKDTIGPVSRAIYVLKEDAMLRNPVTSGQEHEVFNLKESTTEEYLLEREYYKDLGKILMGAVDAVRLQTEIAALVYGIDSNNVDQVVIKRYIVSCVIDNGKRKSFAKYVDNPHFILLLNDVVRNMSVVDYDKIVPLIDTIESNKLSSADSKILKNLWSFLATRYYGLSYKVKEFGDYEHILFSHVDIELAKQCSKEFCQRLINNKEVSGDQLYDQLNTLFSEDFAQSFNPTDICPSCSLPAVRFADYVKRAGGDYNRFPMSADAEELNKVLEESVNKEFPYLTVLSLLKDNPNYNVAEVGNYAVQQLNLKKTDAQTAANFIAVQRLFYLSFQSEIDDAYINTLWQEVQSKAVQAAYDEIYALKAVGSNEQLPNDERHVNVLVEKALFYVSTTQLFKMYLANKSVKYRGNLLKRMLTDNIHDDNPDYPEFIEHWDDIVRNLGVGKDVVIRFADNWGYKHISDQEKEKPFFTLLSDVNWIDTLIDSDTSLAEELVEKCVTELSSQPKRQILMANTSNIVNSNWGNAFQKLIGTDHIRKDNLGTLLEVAVDLLDFMARTGTALNGPWNQLLEKMEYAQISTSVNDLRDKIIVRGQSGYEMNPAKFKLLHGWLEQAEINTEVHRTDAADKILSKVVDDLECQNIILANRDYYRPIIANTVEKSSALHNKLKRLLQKQEITEFTKYLREIVAYGA